VRLALLLLAIPLWAQSFTTAIKGTFVSPDGTLLQGQIQISLVRPTNTLRNTCASPVQVLNFKTVFVPIVDGVATFNLFPTPCLNPSTLYLAKVFDSSRNMLYQTQWNVPKATGVSLQWRQPVTQTWGNLGGAWNAPGNGLFTDVSWLGN